MRKLISADIGDFRKGEFKVSKPWSITGKFIRVRDTNIWVYCHQGHVKCSQATFDNFKMCVDIVQSEPCLDWCESYSQHCEVLQPFFCDNISLEHLWVKTGKMDLVQQLKDTKSANPQISTGMFATPGCCDASGFEYDENTWTKRLVASLDIHLPKNTVMYTAEDAIRFAAYQNTRSLLGTSQIVLQCYPFQGCTDSAIKNIQVQVENEGDDSPNSPLTSGDEAVMEHGKQADRLSPVPPKLGELISAMNISIIQKACRMLFKKKSIKEKITGSGIYINRQTAPCIVKLMMPIVVVDTQCPDPIPRAKLTMSTPVARVLNPQMLCKAIEEVVGTTKCTQASTLASLQASPQASPQTPMLTEYS